MLNANQTVALCLALFFALSVFILVVFLADSFTVFEYVTKVILVPFTNILKATLSFLKTFSILF